MSSPITPQREACEEDAITVAVAVTSTGATVETATLDAGLPAINLDVAHPVLSMWHLVTETDQTADSAYFDPANECARAATPDSANEWAIATATTIAFYSGVDKDGILFITYIPKGVRVQ